VLPVPPDRQRGPGRYSEAPQRSATDKPQIASTVAREQARARLAEQNRRRAICREADRLMPLARYYSCWGGPLLAVPIGRYYVRGRWAA
jgi:hypothetical protein